MSGHSKWHNIQQRKGKQDAARANLFTKYARGIVVAAQKGGGDPNTNFSLRLAIEKAKSIAMPKDNIDRAIKRGLGELTDGAQVEEALYEGFGPAGTAVLIKVLTDNKNRAISDIKHLFSEFGGSLGGQGSVAWMFEQAGVVSISNIQFPISNLSTRDDFEMKMIEAGAEDIWDGDNEIEIKTKIENLQKIIAKLKELGIEPKESGIRWLAKNRIKVDKDMEEKLMSFFSALEENDGVEDYFTNAE